VGLDLGLCFQAHTKCVGDFFTLIGVYREANIFVTVFEDKFLILG
jgi:hypothetical protein